MMMHRKIIELKQAGQNYFAQATKLNDALVEKGESLIHLLSAQEQASAQEPIPSLKQKIIILNTVQEITKELDISRLLNQMPPSTIEYLTGALGLTWPEIGEYLTKDNLNKAITRIEKQITQLNIISDAQNEIGSAHDYAAALFLEPLTAADTDNFGNYLTPNGTFHNLIDTYKTNMASAFAINYETLKKLSAGLLAEPQGSSKGLLAGHEYFLELTAELKKALNLSGTDLLVIHGGKEYLAVTSEEDKTLLERKIFAAYLNAYEKALLNNHLNYFERGPSGAVDPQEETEMASGLTKKSKTGKPEDTLKLYKLLSEMAILKYNYKDVDNSEYVWQFYQYEAGTWPNFIKKLGMKKEIEDIGPAIKKWTDDKKHKLQAVPEADLQKIEKELKPGVDKWSRKLIDERKKDDPHNKNPLSPVRARSIVIKNWADADKLKESPAPEERRAGITLPHIDIGALQNGLRGLTGDPRYRRALLALLALLLLAGGGAGVMQLVKNRQPNESESAEPESLFARAFNTVREIFREAGQKLGELFADPEKPSQELKTESDQIIQEAKDKAEETILSEETNLTPAEVSEARAEASRAEALQAVTDTYLQAREKSDEALAQEYNKSNYAAANEALAGARAALEDEAEKQPGDDTIVRPLAEKLSADLQEREKQLAAEVERQEKLADEAAAKAAEEENRRQAAEAARTRATEAEQEYTRRYQTLLAAFNSRVLSERYIRKLGATDMFTTIANAKSLDDYINILKDLESYYSKSGISAARAKITELEKIEDEIRILCRMEPLSAAERYTVR